MASINTINNYEIQDSRVDSLATVATTGSYNDLIDKPSGGVTLDKVWPVGSIYLSVTSTSPNTLFGGTWVQLKDRFLLGSGDTYSNGATGGEAKHTLTINEMPSHTHGTYCSTGIGGGTTAIRTEGYVTRWELATSATGGSQAHNNMPPYLVVNIWKRTA